MHWKVAVLFEPLAPFSGHLRAILMLELGHLSQNDWKSKASLSSLLLWTYSNKCIYSPNQVWFLYLKLLPSNLNDYDFLTAHFFYCSIFNFFFNFFFSLSLNFSRLGQVADMSHHLGNDFTKKTEVVKQSICHGGVFLLCTALGFTERMSSLVKGRRKHLLIREGHCFSNFVLLDSVVVNLRSWYLLCAPLLHL